MTTSPSLRGKKVEFTFQAIRGRSGIGDDADGAGMDLQRVAHGKAMGRPIKLPPANGLRACRRDG